MLKLKHYIQARKYKNNTDELNRLEPEERALVKEWIEKLHSGEIVINKLTDYPWEPRRYIREVIDRWEVYGYGEEDQKQKEDFLASGESRFRVMSYSSQFYITPRLQEAIDALPGEFIYLDIESDGEEEWEGIHSLMKINVRCEPSSYMGIREFSSSKEVVDYLKSGFPVLKTYYSIPSNDLSNGFLTIDHLRSQMLKENAETLKIHIAELGINTELPVSTQKGENESFNYRIEFARTPIEEWVKLMAERDVSIQCELISPKDVLLKMEPEAPEGR